MGIINVDAAHGVKFRSPNVWNKFDNAYDNLMYAILIRAVADARGYNDFETHKAYNGNDAVTWLNTTGRVYFEYLTKYGKKVKHYEEKKTADRYTKEHRQNQQQFAVNRSNVRREF